MPIKIRELDPKTGKPKKKMPLPKRKPRLANPKHPMNAERTTGDPRGVNRKAGGGKLKMVKKGGKKVPFFAADGVGKMAKGGSVSVGKDGTAKTLSQIAKQNNTSIQALLAANPSIKNANMIRMGQKIKLPKAKSVPGNTKTKNPYARMSQTQMNMMASKDKNKQRTVTRAIRNEAKSGAQTSPTPKLAKATKEKKSGNQAMLDRARKKRAEDKAAGKKSGFLSKLFGKKSGGSMKKVTGYKSGGSCRGGGAATKGKRYGRSG